MKTLLQFLLRYHVFILFLLLEIGAFTLVITNNRYQRSAVFSSCNAMAAGIYAMQSNISGYFHLRTENEQLVADNVALQNRITELENQLALHEDTVPQDYVLANKMRTYLAAEVVNSSTNKQHNYLTINKGKRDGVLPDMGVVSSKGVVGVVCAASEHFALVIPLIHTSLNISAKFADTDYVGTLLWPGKDIRYAELQDVARHIAVQQGDTLVTSGFSAIFPADIPVGVVIEDRLTDSDAYHHILVALSVDFKRLKNVQVIQNHNYTEQKELEASTPL